MSVAADLRRTPVSALVRRPLVRVDRHTPLHEAVPLLRGAPNRCLAVMDGARIVGIFTDRDMVEKCFTAVVSEDTPLEHVMESPLVTVTPDSSIVEALLLMDRERIRHLPLVEADGTLRGLIRGRDLLEYIAETMPEAVLNQPASSRPPRTREGA